MKKKILLTPSILLILAFTSFEGCVPEDSTATKSKANPMTVAPAASNSSPSSFAISAVTPLNSDSLQVSWGPSTNALSYTIKYGTISGSYSTTVSNNASSPATISGLSANTKYYVMVIANNSLNSKNANSEVSATTKVSPTTNAPALGSFAISNIEASGTNSIIVNFGASSNATSYSLKYGTAAGTYTTSLSNVISPTSITGLQAATTYYVMVVANNSSGNKNANAEVSAQTGAIAPINTSAIAIYNETFESKKIPALDGNGFFALDSASTISISSDIALNANGSIGSIRGTYPAPIGNGGYYIWAGHTPVKRDLTDIYIEFDAKMPGNKHGLKFLKIFGQNESGKGYSNTTFGLDYTGVDYGGMYCTSFGDGSDISNDTQNVIFFTGEGPAVIGRSYGVAKVLTPQMKNWSGSSWGKSWHHFKFHLKYNTGTTAANEVANGEYYVEIDGKVYVDAKKLFNRHYLNKPIDRIEFFGWSQSGNLPFELWYDNIRISIGGFLTN